MASPALRLAARWWRRFAARARDSVLRAKSPASVGAAWARRKTRRATWRFMMGRIVRTWRVAESV